MVVDVINEGRIVPVKIVGVWCLVRREDNLDEGCSVVPLYECSTLKESEEFLNSNLNANEWDVEYRLVADLNN